ncbi:hypothetical protein PS710_02584 [Pseudomonas fluorescens]|uniref:Uncharacterized protein n=1 Tax=Pseudomonas fluorescens TaxID=294 RepID=A0A5E7CXR1_PSEFL|nr:hypothetical protein PS710_02584 [Pseudomonas fluorescens]
MRKATRTWPLQASGIGARGLFYWQKQKIAAFGSSLYLDYRSIRSDSSRLIIEGGTWKPRSSLGF